MQYEGIRQTIGSLDCVVIHPSDPDLPITAVAVFCHGFGAGGDDLVGLASELLQIAAPREGIVLVFPAAPLSLDDQGIPGGRAWWLLSLQRLIAALEAGHFEQVREEEPPGIDEARQQLSETIELLLTKYQLDASRLLLGGFSQGAMLAMDTALRGLPQPPAQLCLFSGALICERKWKPHAQRLAKIGILQSHGRFDQILPLQTGLWLRDFCTAAGASVDFIEFDGPHTIPFECIERTGKLLAELVRVSKGV